MTIFARQVVAALDLLERELRREGRRLDPAASALRDGLRVTEVHSGSFVDSAAMVTQDDGMPMVLSYEETAMRLGRSVSTVKRLVRSGDLPAVKVAGTPGVRAADLTEFVEGLQPVNQPRSFRDSVERKAS